MSLPVILSEDAFFFSFFLEMLLHKKKKSVAAFCLSIRVVGDAAAGFVCWLVISV